MLDALVVGAGPSGLTLAAELLAHGLSVRIVDKAEAHPADHSRALAVQVRTLELFERFGIIDPARERSCRVAAVNIVGRNKRRVRAPIPLLAGFGTPYPEMRMLPQHISEELLESRVTSLGGKVERAVEFLGCSQSSDHITVQLQHDGARHALDVRWLFGADGSKSHVRKALGIAFEGDTYDDLCLVGDMDLTWEMPNDELCIFPSRHGVAVTFPQPGQHSYRVVVVLPYGGIAQRRDLTEAEFVPELKRLIPMPVEVARTRFLSRYRLHHRVAAQFRRERAFLLGDAAHVHSPVGGQGMNTGIQDAFNLAWKVAHVTHGRAPAWLLDTYEQERRRVALGLVRDTDRLFGLAAGHGLAGGIIRRLAPTLAAHALTWPVVQNRMFGFMSQLGVRYQHSALTSAPMPGPGPQAGDRMPDAAVKSASGQVVRLYSLLPHGVYVLLLFGGHGGRAMAEDDMNTLARAVCEPYAEMVKPVLVHATSHSQLTYADAGEAHARFGVGESAAFLIRPDGYVAARMNVPSKTALRAELELRLLTPHLQRASA